VEQRADDQYFGSREVGDQPRTKRIFVRVLRLHEPTQVADHHEDVFVDRVDMEQIVLHLTDDAAEYGEITAKNPVLVHSAQFVGNAARLAQDSQKARAIGGVPAERGIDAVAIAPKCAKQWRRHPFELRMLLERQEAFEYRRGPLDEQRVVLQIEQFIHGLKIRIDGPNLDFRGEQARVQVLQQYHIDLANRFRGAIVALHELL